MGVFLYTTLIHYCYAFTQQFLSSISLFCVFTYRYHKKRNFPYVDGNWCSQPTLVSYIEKRWTGVTKKYVFTKLRTSHFWGRGGQKAKILVNAKVTAPVSGHLSNVTTSMVLKYAQAI